jgi:hypothetical protein
MACWKKLLETSIFRFSLEPRVNQIAISIDGTIQVAPVPVYFHVGFIHVPGCSSLSTSLDAELISKQRGKTGFPVVNCLVAEDKTPFQKHLGEITQAQCVALPLQNDEQDKISGIFQKVERCARAFVEGVPAPRAAKRSIAQRGFLVLFFGCRGCAIWAVHGSLLRKMFWLSVYHKDGLHTGPCSQS